jgi:hypothetical protein
MSTSMRKDQEVDQPDGLTAKGKVGDLRHCAQLRSARRLVQHSI